MLWLIVTAHAGGGLPLAWDCYLPSAPVDCTGLGQRLYAMTFSEPAVPSEAPARVRLRAIPEVVGVESFTAYELQVFSPSNAEQPTLTFRERISDALAGGIITQRLLERTLVSLGTVLDVVSAAPGEGSDYTITLRDPSASPVDVDADDVAEDRTQGWYFSPSVSSYFSVNSNSADISAYANARLSWYHPRWRYDSTVGGGYEYSRVSYGDVDDAYTGWSVDGAIRAVRTVHTGRRRGGWSLSLRPFVSAGAGVDNVRLRTGGDVGIGYDLFPFQIADANGNFSFRYEIGPRYLSLIAPNLDGAQRLVYAQQQASVGFDWHFDAADLSGGVGVSSNIPDPAYTDVYTWVSLQLRLTQNVSISPWLSASYANAQIEQPGAATGGTLDDIRASDAWSRFSTDGGVSVNVVVGAAQLAALDQRW
jgi:hypothetical protein